MSYRKHLITSDEPPSELYKATELGTNLAEVGTDCISRQAAIDALDEQIETCDKSLSSFDISMKDAYAVKVERASLVSFREILEYLPSAEPKRGKWNRLGRDVFNCNKCGATFDLNQGGEKMHFCPNCMADMRGEQNEP